MPSVSPKALTSVRRLRKSLDVSSSYAGDPIDLLIYIINAISRYVHNITRRDNFKLNTYTEYYDGSGNDELIVDHYPIISITSLNEDSNREWTSSTLLTEGYTSDFIIDNANAGIIKRLDASFIRGVRVMKIVYKAGFSEFEIVEGENDTIEFKEASGGSALTATLTPAKYNADTLATEIKTQLDTAGGTPVYTVSYSTTSHKFTISSTGTYLQLLWNTGGSPTKALGELLGFNDNDVTDSAAPIKIISDDPVIGLPEDLMLTIDEMCLWMFKYIDKDRVAVLAESRGEQSFTFNFDGMPNHIMAMLWPYRRLKI